MRRAAATSHSPSGLPYGTARTTLGDDASRVRCALRPAPVVDANLATVAELARVPGIDDARAEEIVARRPYMTTRALVTRGALPSAAYATAAAHVVLGPPAMPAYLYPVPPVTWRPR
jgi:hypothetical protein